MVNPTEPTVGPTTEMLDIVPEFQNAPEVRSAMASVATVAPSRTLAEGRSG